MKYGRVVLKTGATANAVKIDATASDIASGSVVIAADNTQTPNVPIIINDDVKAAADTKGGFNSIPNPQSNYVVVLSDKVLDANGNKTDADSAAQLTKSNKNFATVQEALTAMADGDVLIIQKDATVNTELSLIKSSGTYEIDLNGHTLGWDSFSGNSSNTGSNDNPACLYIKGSGTNSTNFSIKNGTLTNTSYIYGALLYVYGSTTINMTNVTINNTDDQKVGASDQTWGAIVFDGETGTIDAVVKNCTINAFGGPGIQHAGNSAKFYNCTVNASNHSAFYCSCGAVSELYDCNVYSKTIALHACTSGHTFKVYGGTYKGDSAAIQLDNDKNSGDWQGTPNYESGSFAIIEDGNFIGNLKAATGANAAAAIYINGGTFDKAIPDQANIMDYRK